MKPDNVERHAVPEDRLQRFMGIVYSLVEPFGVKEVPDVYHFVELLGHAVDRHVAEAGLPVSQNRQTNNRRKFIAIFKNRFLSNTDLEYRHAVTGVDAKMINQINKILEEKGFEVDEYLAWLFDVFLNDSANNKYNPPTIKWSCSGWVLDKFIFDNREKIKERVEKEMQEKIVLDLVSRARALIRIHEDDVEMKKKIIGWLKGYSDRSIMLEQLRDEVEKLEKIVREKQESQSKATGQSK